MKVNSGTLLTLALLLSGWSVSAQKEVFANAHFWTSVNNVYRLSNNFGLLTDFHIRRTNFLKDPSFYFLRGGARFWLEPKVNVSAGYAHMWLAPVIPTWSTFANENRIYQEIQMAGFFNKSSTLFRIRNEQRWRERIVDDQSTGTYLFNFRLRMLLSASIPFNDDPHSVRLMIANEIHINLGRQIVFNTFDQNRFTIGINKKIGEKWRFDLGYMLVYQQLADGLTYSMNHTLRLFFYGAFDFRKSIPGNEPQIINHAEE